MILFQITYTYVLLIDLCLSFKVGRTEKVQNCLNPKFAKKFLLDYYFEVVQKVKFGVYDIDNATVDLSDDDFLGEFECTLGQVRSLFVSHTSCFGGGVHQLNHAVI